jgi:RNA polymerase sigma-70 factor (ECF subfamily)
VPPAPSAELQSPIDRNVLADLRPGLELIGLRAFGDATIAEEIAQDAIARALIASDRGTLIKAGGTAAFVAGIARHIIADRRRAASREAPLSAADSVPTTEADPLERLLADDEAMRVRAALSQLAPADRELLRLSYFDGQSPAEIADGLGEPSERIRKRKSRALDRLRQLLTPSSGHESAAAPTIRLQHSLAPSEDVP